MTNVLCVSHELPSRRTFSSYNKQDTRLETLPSVLNFITITLQLRETFDLTSINALNFNFTLTPHRSRDRKDQNRVFKITGYTFDHLRRDLDAKLSDWNLKVCLTRNFKANTTADTYKLSVLESSGTPSTSSPP
ncbi:MAG: hypothetical protein S4CHLAM7_00360 [Chlamydiae bacterium]|nr:hypothetical protein [Chlamydiota bacterium]